MTHGREGQGATLDSVKASGGYGRPKEKTDAVGCLPAPKKGLLTDAEKIRALRVAVRWVVMHTSDGPTVMDEMAIQGGRHALEISGGITSVLALVLCLFFSPAIAAEIGHPVTIEVTATVVTISDGVEPVQVDDGIGSF